MHIEPRLLDVVALLTDVPEHCLVRGQVGTVVEILDGAYEVEFCDDEGRTYGGVPGFTTHIYRMPDVELCVVVLGVIAAPSPPTPL